MRVLIVATFFNPFLNLYFFEYLGIFLLFLRWKYVDYTKKNLAKLGKKLCYVKGIYFVQIKGQVISEGR